VDNQRTPSNASQGNGFGQNNGYNPQEGVQTDPWQWSGTPPPAPSQSPEISSKANNVPSGGGLLSKWKANQEPNANANNMVNTAPNPLNPAPASQPNWGSSQQPVWQGSPSALQYNMGAEQPFSPAPGSLPSFGGQPAPTMPGLYSHATQLSPGQQVMPPMAPMNSIGAYPQTNAPFTQGQQPMPPTGTGFGTPYPQANPAFGQRPTMVMPGGPTSSPTNWQATAAYGGPPPFMQPPPGGNGNGTGKSGNNGRKRKKKRRFPIWARVVVAFLLFLLVVTGSGAYYYYANFAAPVSKITGQTVTRIKGDSAPQGHNANTSGSSSILSGGRVNILLLGSDDDYKSIYINHGILAQTDIVVSIDPASKSVSMFSIPRDSWVDVPGYGMHKLDEAYMLGGGGTNGAALSMATIHQDFGIYINQYAWVGLSGFVKVIDTVGGIDMDLIHPITDDAYPDDTGKGATDPYAYKRLYLAPGPQHLDGLTALEYVRSRHADLVGDFGRSVRQQQILDQLKYKLDNPNIIGELPALANDLAGSVKTSMQLTDVFSLMYFAKSLGSGSIHNYTLGPPYSTTAQITLTGGSTADIVVLDCSKVQPMIAQIFALGNSATCGQVDTNNPYTVPVPVIAPQQTPTAGSTGQITAPAAPSTNAWQSADQMAQIGSMSLSNGNSDFTGIRSLLDLMFAVVFESPDAMLV
jgi:LCP family protein required for cell wall assembly